MIRPERATVTPRVLAPETGDTVPLDEAFLPGEGLKCGAIEIVGGPGSGKTTTLAHLAVVVPPDMDVVFMDEPLAGHVTAQAAKCLAVYSSPVPRSAIDRRSFHLASWGDDELIEYLLAVHADQCRSVMRRLGQDSDRRRLAGIPALWRIVLDRMAQDASLIDARDALLRDWQANLPKQGHQRITGDYCLTALSQSEAVAEPHLQLLSTSGCDARPLRLLRHRVVRVLLGAGRMAGALGRDEDCSFLQRRLPRDLVSQAAGAIANHAVAADRLRALLAGRARDRHAMAASILHATGIGWTPGREPRPCLQGAYLEGASWPGVDLSKMQLSRADLTAANLAGSKMDHAGAANACLRHACLHGASLDSLLARGADLSHADLSCAVGKSASFREANLEQANLEGAQLFHANFQGADLAGARFCGAEMRYANFLAATIDSADFSGADLRKAWMVGLRFTDASVNGARLSGANLARCDLEYVRFPNADFELACLREARLSGSFMPHANFHGANLAGTQLADVEWERSDLRDADLRGCSFHMGSSRSGLVGSPIASEGTRTGFYTDDFSQQHFKPPEEIRKANLCGADLRGAKIENTDFYLVDLRGARYSIDQGRHFRRCGAILFDPA